MRLCIVMSKDVITLVLLRPECKTIKQGNMDLLGILVQSVVRNSSTDLFLEDTLINAISELILFVVSDVSPTTVSF